MLNLLRLSFSVLLLSSEVSFAQAVSINYLTQTVAVKNSSDIYLASAEIEVDFSAKANC